MDIKHFYIEKGKGFPLILLHGNGEDSSYFQEQIDSFSEYFHVYAIDTRGHGKTPRGKQPFTLYQFAEDLFEFMNEQQIAKAHILGFSDGGNIALIFSLQHPDRVEKLILNGANLNPGGVKRSVQIPVELGYRIAGFFARKSESARKKAELLGLMTEEPDLKPADLTGIKSRTLVIAGTSDMIKENHTKLIAESIKDAELIFIDGDHFIAAKQAEAFNQAVLDFLVR